MNCRKCGTVNPDEAVFCKNCGSRIDGKKECPVCGKTIDDESVFCVYCGARTDGKKVCPKCGTAHDGDFCPQCGTANEAEKPKSAKAPKESSGKVSRIIGLVGGGLAMCALFMAVLFMFFTGVTASLGAVSSGTSAALSASRDIYYLMMHCFDDANEFRDFALMQSFADQSALNTVNSVLVGMNVIAVVQLISIITMLLLVAVFATLAIVRFVMNVTGKSEKDYMPAVSGAVLSYVGGALAVLAFMYIKISIATSGVGAEAGTTLNDATTAGMVLSLVFLLLATACRVAAKGRALLSAKAIASRAVSLAGAVLGLVGMFLLAYGAVTMTYATSGGQGVVEIGAGYMPSYLVGHLGQGSAMPTDNIVYDFWDASSAFTSCSSFAIAAYVMELAAIVFVAFSIERAIVSVIDGKRSVSQLIYIIMTFLYALLAAIFIGISKSAFADIYTLVVSDISSYKFGVSASAIASVVIAGLFCAATVTHMFLAKSDN